MEVRELGHGVPDALVDGAGDLAALRVGERNVHVTRRHRGGHGLEAIGHGEHDVRLEVLEQRGQLEDAEPRRLGHRRRRLALHDRVDGGGRSEAVPLDDLPDVAEPVEQRGGPHDEAQLEVGPRLDGGEDGLDPSVVRPAVHHHADRSRVSPRHSCPPT